jgi:8-oxo-dGTP diphosphatase
MKRVDVAYSLIYDEMEERVLMVKNTKNDLWSLPGGGVETGETLEQAAVREAYEETGLTITVENILCVNEAFMMDHDHHVLFITFKGKIIGGELSIQDKKGISEVEWVDFQTANQRMPYLVNGVQSLLESWATYVFQGEK